MKRFWSWWKRTANEFAHAVYLDDLPIQIPPPKASGPLPIGEKLFLMLVVAVGVGGLAWNFALGDNGRITDSWIGENPATFGIGLGAVLYLLGMLTIIAIDRRG